MLEIKPNETFALPKGIFLQKIDDLEKYLVFNIETGDHFSLNASSFWILEKIAEKLSVEKIFTEYLDRYDVAEKEAKTDLKNIINEFLKEKIIIKEENNG